MTSRAKAHPHENPHHQHWPLAALLFVFVFLIASYSVHESGTWLNIRTGADILAKRALPAADTFSYTVSGRPWTTDSWLSDVLFRHLHRSGGAAALGLVKAMVIAAAFALLLPLNPSSPLFSAGMLALGAAAAWPGMTETPRFFDLLFLALLIRVLRPKRPFTWATVAQVGIVEALWANLDGPGALLGVWLVGLKVVKTSFHAGKGERLRFGALMAAALAGLALNPHGLSIAPQMFLGAPSATAWTMASPWLNLYSLFVVAGGAAVWVCLQQEFFLSLTAASLLALSLVLPALRPLYLLAACPLLALALGHFLTPWRDTLSRVARLALALAALFAWHWQAVYVPLGHGSGYGVSGLDGAVTFLKANGVTGRMFNEPQTGDELLAVSGRSVFVDSRAELYGAAFMKDAEGWPSRWRQLAEAYRFDYAVLRNRRAGYPARVLDESPDWRLAYADDAALVYLRRSGSSAWLVASVPRRLAPPNQLWPEALDSLLAQPLRRGKALEELDRWIVASPESAQPLLWKAYAFDRLNLPQKADRLLALARGRIERRAAPELWASLGFVLERRGQESEGLRAYRRAAALARRQRDGALEAAVSLRLAAACRRGGDEALAGRYEARARELERAPEE